MTVRGWRRDRAAALGLAAGVALAGMAVYGGAAAQDAAWKVHPALQDRWTFQLGAFFPKIDTNANLNGTGGRIGTELSFENDLGFDDTKTVPTLLIGARLGERWRIEGEYLALNRSHSQAISRTINWGDRTFTLGTTVSSDFDSDIYRLSVGYSFIKDDKAELGVVLGAHITDFEVSLSAPGTGGQSGDTLAPLPTIGLYGSYAFTPRWLLSARVDYFSLNYNEYDGSLVNVNVGVDYRVARNFGIGLGYRHVDYDLNVSKSRFNGSVNYKFNGPIIYMVGSF